MPPEEKTLSLSFEITMPDVRGGLNFAVPVSVSNALLRKMTASWTHRRPRGRGEWLERLRRRVLDCPFPVELGIKRRPGSGERVEPVTAWTAFAAALQNHGSGGPSGRGRRDV